MRTVIIDYGRKGFFVYHNVSRVYSDGLSLHIRFRYGTECLVAPRMDRVRAIYQQWED
jgi:hypothetical protein